MRLRVNVDKQNATKHQCLPPKNSSGASLKIFTMVRKTLETRNRNDIKRARLSGEETKNNNKVYKSKTKPANGVAINYSKLCCADEVPLQFRESFILSGYRLPYMTARECVLSLFTLCNESVNVWSHILALFFFCCHYYSVFWRIHNPLDDPFVYPLLSFAFGVSCAFLMSAGAHLFNSMSPRIRHVCFFFDYAAISVYTYTAGQAFYFYSRPLGSELTVLNNSSLFLAISMLISFATTTVCCASRHHWHHYKHLLRTSGYTLSWFFNTLPYTWRMYTCDSEQECHAISKAYFMRHVLCYAVAAIANASKLPERLMPGVFDFIGQSHHFLHIVSAMGAGDEFITMVLDMEGMREEQRLQSVSFGNTIGLTALVLFGNVVIVLLFAVCLDNDEEEEKVEDC